MLVWEYRVNHYLLSAIKMTSISGDTPSGFLALKMPAYEAPPAGDMDSATAVFNSISVTQEPQQVAQTRFQINHQ